MPDHAQESVELCAVTIRVSVVACPSPIVSTLASVSIPNSADVSNAGGLIELLRPMIKARFRDELRMQIRKASEEGGPEPGPFALPPAGFRLWRLLRVDREGRVARLRRYRETSHGVSHDPTLRSTMEDCGDRIGRTSSAPSATQVGPEDGGSTPGERRPSRWNSRS